MGKRLASLMVSVDPKIFLFAILFVFLALRAGASLLYQFSPLAEITVRNLGMEDKNGNGTIDRGAGEGYEEFIERYGNADIGFHANGVVYGAGNGRLEENEIINYYYINIRFKPEFTRETETIDSETASYIYANSIPLVWLDDEQGTVMNAVNPIMTRLVGDDWQNRQYTEDEAVRLFEQVMRLMRIAGRTGNPRNTGYHTLPEFATRRSAYCFETAQFGFWFFSELKINSMVSAAYLTPSILHGVIELTSSSRKIDYFGSSNSYNIPAESWGISNPIQSYSIYYKTLSQIEERANRDALQYRELVVLYNKYDLNQIGLLMQALDKKTTNKDYAEIINLGEFLLNNINLDDVMSSSGLSSRLIKNNLVEILLLLLESYSITKNADGFSNIENILSQYFMRPGLKYTETQIQRFINAYRRNFF